MFNKSSVSVYLKSSRKLTKTCLNDLWCFYYDKSFVQYINNIIIYIRRSILYFIIYFIFYIILYLFRIKSMVYLINNLKIYKDLLYNKLHFDENMGGG